MLCDAQHSQFEGAFDHHSHVGAAVRESNFPQDRRAVLADQVRQQRVQKKLLLLQTPARSPTNGDNFQTLFLNGQLHLRSSLGRQLIAPVTLPSGADVQFNGSNAADRLTLDRSWSGFTGSLTFNGNGGNDQFDAHTVTKVIDTSFIFDFDALLASLM